MNSSRRGVGELGAKGKAPKVVLVLEQRRFVRSRSQPEFRQLRGHHYDDFKHQLSDLV